MERIKPHTLSGFMELLPAPQQQMEAIMDVLRTTYSLYGFTPLDTPAIESADVLLARRWTLHARCNQDEGHASRTRLRHFDVGQFLGR